MSRLSCFLVWLSSAAAPLVVAQAPPTDSLAERLGAVTRIRVHSAAGWAELEHPNLAGESLHFARGRTIDSRTGRRADVAPPLPLTGIDRIDVRAGTHAGRGAMIGGLIGAGLGIAAGIALSQDGLFQVGTGEVAAVMATLTAAGAGVGALLGVLVPRWRPVYPATGAP